MPSLYFGLCAFTIICSLVLGGGTRGGFLSDGILQFLALPLLLVTLWRLVDLRSATVGKNRPLRWELLFCGALVLLPLLQLIPLPPSIWSALPNRKPEAAVFDLLGGGMPWMPISVSPEATWISALSLLPPIAIFLGCLFLSYRERRLMSLVVLSVGVVSVFLGLIQVSQGPSSPLRFFAITNPSEAVGFFANRNHFAALLYALTLFAAAWAVDATRTAQSGGHRKQYDTATVVPLVASFAVLIILVSAQAMARSRAGLGLTMLAVFGGFALAYPDRRVVARAGRRHWFGMTPAKLLVLGSTALAIMFVVQFALYRVMERFVNVDPLDDARIPIAWNTIEAAKDYMPVGAGMGAFVPVYAMYQKVPDLVGDAYINRAHDDVLEWWLETGIAGIVLMGIFLLWLVLRSMKIWRRAPHGAREIDYSLPRAATLIIGLLIAHSFFDFALRTGAIMAIMAFACALLIEPPTGAAREVEAEASTGGRRMRRRPQPQQAVVAAASPRSPLKASGQASAPATIPPRQPAGVFAESMDWPEEWRKPANHAAPGFGGGNSDKPPKS